VARDDGNITPAFQAFAHEILVAGIAERALWLFRDRQAQPSFRLNHILFQLLQ